MTVRDEETINAAADNAANTILLTTGLPSSPDSFRAAMRAAAWAAATGLLVKPIPQSTEASAA